MTMTHDQLAKMISDTCIAGVTNSMPALSSSLATNILSAMVPVVPPSVPPPVVSLGQHPALLNNYVKRPSWKVAGVDYAVGVPSTATLSDWQLLSGPGIVVNATAVPPHVDVYGVSNAVISGVDFSLHGGASLRFENSPNPTVINCNFGGINLYNTLNAIIWADPDSPGLTVKYSTIDGAGGPSGQLSTLISTRGFGVTTLEYNWLKNFPQHVLEMAQPAGTTMSVIYRYNLIEQGGMDAGAHLNYLQFGLGTVTSVDVEYNTTYQLVQAGAGEGFQFQGMAGSSITNVIFAYNVMIATGASIAMSYLVRGFSQTPGVAHDNYFDTSAAYGWNYPGSLAGWSLTNNYDMRNGNLLAAL